MKKFKFNLENVLQLKKFNEEECRIALGLAISLLNEIENKIKETARKHHHAANELLKNPEQIMIWSNYISRLEYEAEKLMEDAVKAEMVVEEKRTIYMDAFKELKVMEKLKEKKEKEYKKEAEKKESADIDEIYAARRFKCADKTLF